MENKQIVLMIGSLFLFLGVFAPVDSVPHIGGLSYIGIWNNAGTLLLILAALSLGLAFYDRCRWAWATGALSFVMILGALWMRLSGNMHYSSLGDESGAWPWGWMLLMAGASLQIASAALHEWSERPKK
jgi:hypothetical protein